MPCSTMYPGVPNAAEEYLTKVLAVIGYDVRQTTLPSAVGEVGPQVPAVSTSWVHCHAAMREPFSIPVSALTLAARNVVPGCGSGAGYRS